MIIGNGLVARAFSQYADDKDVLIFASGVSSSKSCTVFDCRREEGLLRETLGKCSSHVLIVYFSSCGVDNYNLINDKYYIHKKKMESVVKECSNKNVIFRLSYVIGGIGNPRTLFNYFVDKVKSQKKFDLWHGARRNIIDIDDVVSLVGYIIQNGLFENETVNIANLKDNTVDEIVNEISEYLKLEAYCSLIECSDGFKVDTNKIKPIVSELGLDFGNNYLKDIVVKYCNKEHRK
jgi:nucleoside-diphosphate-sugar epimerase